MMFDLDDLVDSILERANSELDDGESLSGEFAERAKDLAADQARLYLLKLAPSTPDDLQLAERAMRARIANLRSAGEGFIVDLVSESLDSIGLEALAFLRSSLEG